MKTYRFSSSTCATSSLSGYAARNFPNLLIINDSTGPGFRAPTTATLHRSPVSGAGSRDKLLCLGPIKTSGNTIGRPVSRSMAFTDLHSPSISDSRITYALNVRCVLFEIATMIQLPEVSLVLPATTISNGSRLFPAPIATMNAARSKMPKLHQPNFLIFFKASAQS